MRKRRGKRQRNMENMKIKRLPRVQTANQEARASIFHANSKPAPQTTRARLLLAGRRRLADSPSALLLLAGRRLLPPPLPKLLGCTGESPSARLHGKPARVMVNKPNQVGSCCSQSASAYGCSSLDYQFSKKAKEMVVSRVRRRDTDHELRSLIFNSACQRRSATVVLQKWMNEGHRISASQLRCVYRQLIKRRCFGAALEILIWMESQDSSSMSPSDYANRSELTIKMYGSKAAEEHFENLHTSISKKASCLPLLHCYVKERCTEKAEALMAKMNNMGFAVTTQPFNEMMKLYMATSQYTKVLSVILQMMQNRIPLNVLSYNLWMSACGNMSGISSAESVYKEMIDDPTVDIGWTSLCTLAEIYLKFRLTRKAILVLELAEKKLSTCNRLAYFFLITLYTSLNNKEGVLRLWEASKGVGGRMTCANYMCMISSLVKLGEIEEAESVFREWECQCRTYDVRVPNILLGAYMRNGFPEKAELLCLHILERGGIPNYKTWEILMEGWVRSRDLSKD